MPAMRETLPHRVYRNDHRDRRPGGDGSQSIPDLLKHPGKRDNAPGKLGQQHNQ